MSPHSLHRIWAFSTVAVLAVVAVLSPWADGSAVRFVAVTGLFLLAPMSLFGALVSVAPFLRNVAPATFIALSISAIGVLLLAWRAPPGDDVFVFSIYVAVSVTILVISCVVGLWKSRRRL